MIPVPVGRGRSIRSATGGGSGLWVGGSGSFFLADRERGRGFACGQRFALRPTAADCPPADPRPLSLERVLWSRTRPARSLGGCFR